MVGRRVHTNSSEGKTYKSRVKAVTIFIVTKCVKNNCCLLQRGGVLIKKWGRSSAASTAVSIADAMKSLVTPTKEGDWFSSGVSFEDFTLICVLRYVHVYVYAYIHNTHSLYFIYK